MDNSIYVALSRLTALERQMDVTSNNIANANSTGFKAERVLFETYLQKDDAALAGEGTNYVLDRGSYVDNSSGAVMPTGNTLDLALSGEGWFAYETPQGDTAFGRDGALILDAQGRVITASGAQILDAGGAPMVLPPDQASTVSISDDGVISDAEGAVLGQVGVFTLPDRQSLGRSGGGMFVPQDGNAQLIADETNTRVIQGAVEMSNVQAVTEVTRLIEIQQAYQQSLNLVQQDDELKKEMLTRIRNS
ncbi:flagellar biosynthesis protein FlgF (plasmid) [Salipiger sp. CCB-MM3]|uniref:flagellar basal-body rod protein FlgF n=1 Tax=Roseobacteraceae TaxID=2854170 RepID=UPI00080ABCBD|nr:MULTISPECIES: flagellar basal-body rod protein FlgF [Roseobacteraceae]ANT63175.1 flagellar biosynthesis protein FlgF [Salipiger sp. CCB-MM3]MCA0994904.1 flagellar basal-body rod protein FlgF [Alloyangia pacifica]